MAENCTTQPITRYTAAPTNLDYQPFGTLCLVIKNDACTDKEYFVQTSKDEKDPKWISAQDLLIKVHSDLLHDPCFLQQLLKQI